MRWAIVTKTFRFEAAHSLPFHRGKCARLHGHSYRLEVSLRGPLKACPDTSDHGMVMDFSDLSTIVTQAVVERLDHQDLNAVTGVYTTAELLVHWIWEALVAGGLPDDLLWRLRLWETETGCIEITQQEREETETCRPLPDTHRF
ncbi:MAG: 6-carboxytetrahydropterin synthase QueD [Ktedonobacteraceae bacterium]